MISEDEDEPRPGTSRAKTTSKPHSANTNQPNYAELTAKDQVQIPKSRVKRKNTEAQGHQSAGMYLLYSSRLTATANLCLR